MAGPAAWPISCCWSRPSASACDRFVRTPWQPYLIGAFATFVGEVAEGFVIDTDHWRHFFLLLGMIWGLAAATMNHRRREVWERRSAAGDALAASWR